MSLLLGIPSEEELGSLNDDACGVVYVYVAQSTTKDVSPAIGDAIDTKCTPGSINTDSKDEMITTPHEKAAESKKSDTESNNTQPLVGDSREERGKGDRERESDREKERSRERDRVRTHRGKDSDRESDKDRDKHKDRSQHQSRDRLMRESSGQSDKSRYHSSQDRDYRESSHSTKDRRRHH